MTTRLLLAGAACGLLLNVTAFQAPAAPPQVRIVTPGPDDYATGVTRITADVQPAHAAREVVFSVDGRRICTVTQPPYICDWDAGSSVVRHEIRVVANLVAGGRTIATARTRSLGFAESVDVDVVNVTATVMDGRRYVKGLPQSAFHVFEDGRPQTISHFESEGVPLDLTVAIDLSSSMTPSLAKLKAAVKTFLQTVPPTDKVSLLAFNDNIFMLSRHTTDPDARIRAIDSLTSWGHTALYDVIVRGTELANDETGRKAMIVFTDGEDQGSHAGLEDVEHRLQASDLTLYMIGQGRGTSVEAVKKIMKQLAEPTGGRALFTDNIDELHGAFTNLLEELSSQYLLGYSPTNARHDGTIRHIKVTVDGHDDVRARQAYLARAGGGAH